MKNKFPIYLILLLLLVGSCITPITDFEQVSYNKFLTIEASLTDQPDSQVIILSNSSANLKNTFILPIEGATVYILDENGKKEVFKEDVIKGKYLSSPTFNGKVGSTYTLYIGANGQNYQSSPETMKAVPEIENLISRYELNGVYVEYRG